jgi:hypothetical protein
LLLQGMANGGKAEYFVVPRPNRRIPAKLELVRLYLPSFQKFHVDCTLCSSFFGLAVV